MTICELLAKVDYRLRPLIINNFPKFGVHMYSLTRKFFLNALAAESFDGKKEIPTSKSKVLWGIKFNTPLFNAAGMYKNGEGYNTVYHQGAGAFLCGTATANKREGNIKNGVKHPFISYPVSESASNWMGLPNYGFEALARKVQNIDKKDGCPIGVSISPDPSEEPSVAVQGVIDGLRIFQDTQADFIEINESCPNVPHRCDIDDSGLDKLLVKRLERISNKFISNRTRNLPLIIKFSNDTSLELVPKLMKLLIDLNFDGVNFGNTSTDYDYIRTQLKKRDIETFEYFVGTFGGGVSGAVIKDKSLKLCAEAAEYLSSNKPNREFHIIRTGGVQNIEDIEKSEEIGVSLNQWYTGYFEAFAANGHNLYSELFK